MITITRLKRFFLFPLVALLSIHSLGASEFPPEFIKIEKQALQMLKEKKVDDAKLLHIYLLAGRELHDYNFMDKSTEYYQKALDLKVEGSKAEAHINLVGIALTQNDKASAIKRLEAAEAYFAKYPQEKSPGIGEWLKAMDRILRTAGQGPYDYKGFFGQYVAMNDLQTYMEKKDYTKALAMLNPKSISEASSPIVLISYDVLQTLVYGKVDKTKLKCLPIQQKSKQSDQGYTLQICNILLSYLDSGKLSPDRLQKLDRYLSAVDQDKKYLLSALRDLK